MILLYYDIMINLFMRKFYYFPHIPCNSYIHFKSGYRISSRGPDLAPDLSGISAAKLTLILSLLTCKFNSYSEPLALPLNAPVVDSDDTFNNIQAVSVLFV